MLPAELLAQGGMALSADVIGVRCAAQVYDLMTPVPQGACERIEPIHADDTSSPALSMLRHSAAHLLAQAVKALFPGAQLATGPATEDGFYYDIAYERPLTSDDLPAIEARMAKLAAQNLPIVRQELPREEALRLFAERGEPFKLEIIQEIPADQPITVYRQGDFLDLCRGPHVPATGLLKATCLMKISGAYWRGNPENPQLTRIYGTAWFTQQALDGYLQRLKEAQRRDHRLLGPAMELFHLQEEAPGMVFWHERGWRLFRIIQDDIRRRLERHGYAEVHTPMLADRSLWERSGHWSLFQEAMFTTASEHRLYAVKPMNCPCHVQIFKQGIKSYRDLPIRLAEFGSCHRNEPSGTLHGLLRLRAFVQDDAHIFCRPDQVFDEVNAFIALLMRVYHDFGFDDVLLRLATRPQARMGDDALWDRSEQALEEALRAQGMSYEVLPGEGAFYGPKIEFALNDCLGRIWQCGTIQVDLVLPGRLGAVYVDEHSQKVAPVMLHRAILGSLERFIGILIEHHAGWLPLWLAPVQAAVLSLTERHESAAQALCQQLQEAGIRAVADLRNETLGFKIRQQTMQKVPYLLVLGDRELAEGTVAVRHAFHGRIGTKTVAEVLQMLHNSPQPQDGPQKGCLQMENDP